MATNERIDHLERLLEVVRGLTTAPDLESFLQTVINEATELTNSELASILEYDEGAEELRFLSMNWFERDLLRPMGVPLDGSAAGWVFRRGQPLIVQDTKVDKRHFKMVDDVTKHETHSLVAVPLMVRGQVLGVLEALNKKDDAHYTEEDLTILETLGALAAQAMQNVSLQRKVRASKIELAELERLKTDFIAITSHELRTPLGLILNWRVNNLVNNWTRSYGTPPSSRKLSRTFQMWIITTMVRPWCVQIGYRWRRSLKTWSRHFKMMQIPEISF
jgi:GAF domain-containing protein